MAEPHGTCQHCSRHQHGTGRSPHSQRDRDDGEDQTPTHSTRRSPASPLRAQPQHGGECGGPQARVTHKMEHTTEIKLFCRKISFHICYLSVGGLRFVLTWQIPELRHSLRGEGMHVFRRWVDRTR